MSLFVSVVLALSAGVLASMGIAMLTPNLFAPVVLGVAVMFFWGSLAFLNGPKKG